MDVFESQLNEEGKIIDFLSGEAKHISSILIPIPDDMAELKDIIAAARQMVKAKEDAETAHQKN